MAMIKHPEIETMKLSVIQRFLHKSIVPIICLVICVTTFSNGQSYDDVYRLYQDLFTNYSTFIRPVLNQSEKISINPACVIVSMVDVDEIKQEFTVNGFLNLGWTDERLRWNPADYNGITSISPFPSMVWRARVILLNTMGDRDLFADDYAPISVGSDGEVQWYPGGLFPATCSLDLRKFPFDDHICSLEITFMQLTRDMISIDIADPGCSFNLFVENGEWTVDKSLMRISNVDITRDSSTSFISVDLYITRRPTFFLINILFPVLIIYILNGMVFAIPVDSGEKISYSISVLLSLSVYMGIVNGFLPSNSENMPYMVNFIFLLFLLSALSCIDTIIIVYLHHKEEDDDKRLKNQNKLADTLSKLRAINKLHNDSWHHPAPNVEIGSDDEATGGTPERTEDKHNKMMDGNIQNEIPRSDPGSSFFHRKLKAMKRNRIDADPPVIIPVPKPEPIRKKPVVFKNLAQKVNNISGVVYFLLGAVLTIGYLIKILD